MANQGMKARRPRYPGNIVFYCSFLGIMLCASALLAAQSTDINSVSTVFQQLKDMRIDALDDISIFTASKAELQVETLPELPSYLVLAEPLRSGIRVRATPGRIVELRFKEPRALAGIAKSISLLGAGSGGCDIILADSRGLEYRLGLDAVRPGIARVVTSVPPLFAFSALASMVEGYGIFLVGLRLSPGARDTAVDIIIADLRAVVDSYYLRDEDEIPGGW